MADEILVGLQSTMDNLATAISNQGVGSLIEPFNGEPYKFKDWIRQVEKYSLMNNLDQIKQIKIAFMTSRGAVSDYIFRWQTEVEPERHRWEILKNDLTARFSAITDSNHAHALLRQIKQKPNEPVTLYGERLYNLAQEAYSQTNVSAEGSKAIVQRQLIDYFIDGLNHDGTKYKIMRESPRTLEDAIRVAMGEQNLRKRFALRNAKGGSQDNDRETPMEVDHTRKLKCRFCQRTNHTSSQCRYKQVNEVRSHDNNGQRPNGFIPRHRNEFNPRQTEDQRRCYYCGSPEHFRSSCEKYRRDMQTNKFNYRSNNQGN